MVDFKSKSCFTNKNTLVQSIKDCKNIFKYGKSWLTDVVLSIFPRVFERVVVNSVSGPARGVQSGTLFAKFLNYF